MKIAFNTPARKRLTAVAVLVAAIGYVGLAAREVVASWLGGRAELSSLRRAAWLDPSNGDYRDHVGRYYDLVARDPLSAIGYYQQAVRLNPHSARFWFDLASAYQILGDTVNQTAALERAIQADSMTPDVAWEAANLYLVQGENEKALHEFRVVMANDPSLENVAILYCWRVMPNVDLLLQDVVPHSADAYIAFLNLLQTKEETAGSIKVWNALMETRQPFESRFAYDYFKFLIQHKEVDPALQVWRQTVDRFGLSSYLPAPNNLVVNGTFELKPLNAGLDWQYQKQSSVKLMLDPIDHHTGRRSLSVNFDGPGIVDAGIYQYVPVQPDTTYEFSAFYKNGEMEGAGGPHFTIQDMYTQAVYYESDELKEAGFWKSAEGEFKTGPDCKLVVLHMRRLPAGSPFRGKLWVDDFRLTKKPS
ncbi:MAG TPA: tetratricopeptide repeat protein [Candidatus Solibacter sp.]|nr:tetratricopeptide repeat protein [Candidatus Solibacter sp.]